MLFYIIKALHGQHVIYAWVDTNLVHNSDASIQGTEI